MALKIKQAPNEPGVFEMKKALREAYEGHGLKIKQENHEWYYIIDTDMIDDMEMFAEAIRFTISDVDFARYFDSTSPEDALQEMTRTVETSLQDALPVRLEADVCALQKIAQNRYLLELTCEEGVYRIRAIATAEQVGRSRIAVNERAIVAGHWRMEETRGCAEIEVEFLKRLPVSTDFDRYTKTQYLAIQAFERTKEKRQPHAFGESIANWRKIALVTNEEKTASDFVNILKRKKSPLFCDIVYVRFSEEALSYKLVELSESSKYDAICIIKSIPKDMYTFQSLYGIRVYEAINKSKIPVLAGVGRDEDQPYGLAAADYIASTYSALAIQIDELQRLKRIEKEHGGLFGGFFRKIIRALNPFQ